MAALTHFVPTADNLGMMWFRARQPALDSTSPANICELITIAAENAGLVATVKPVKDQHGFHRGDFYCAFHLADASRGIQIELLPHVIKLPSGSELTITYSREFCNWLNI